MLVNCRRVLSNKFLVKCSLVVVLKIWPRTISGNTSANSVKLLTYSSRNRLERSVLWRFSIRKWRKVCAAKTTLLKVFWFPIQISYLNLIVFLGVSVHVSNAAPKSETRTSKHGYDHRGGDMRLHGPNRGPPGGPDGPGGMYPQR